MIAELDYTYARAIETALDGPETTALPRDTLQALKALYEAVCAERDELADELSQAQERSITDGDWRYSEGYDEGYDAGKEAAS